MKAKASPAISIRRFDTKPPAFDLSCRHNGVDAHLRVEPELDGEWVLDLFDSKKPSRRAHLDAIPLGRHRQPPLDEAILTIAEARK